MHKKWLLYVAVVTGIMVVCLLVLAINRGPLVEGFQPYEGEQNIKSYCLWCDEEEPLKFQDVLGTVLIALLILAIPSSHIAVLIFLAIKLGRGTETLPSQPAYQCPYCEHPLLKRWKICPYCGKSIAAAQDHPAETRQEE
jgi:hypothetical protein